MGSKITLAATLLGFVLGFAQTANASEAAARQAGDWRIKGGLAWVNPNDDSSVISANGVGVADTSVEVDDAWALGLIVNYAVTPEIAVELLASTPFEHDVSAKGLEGLGITDIGSVSHLPPTVTVQFYPWGSENQALQPYLGVGVNYWMPFDEDLDGSFENVLGNSSLDVDDSWGVAAQVGADYTINDKWALSASVWYIKIDTEAQITTPTFGFEDLRADVDIDPWVFFFGVSRKF